MSLGVRGLPPTLEEQDRFLKDQNHDSYASLVERFLGDPAHGEKWARHWLDLVRYADSNGYERDAAKPSVWKYRDYVIAAFNNDKPYDRFVLEQLAGTSFLSHLLKPWLQRDFMHWELGRMRSTHWKLPNTVRMKWMI